MATSAVCLDQSQNAILCSDPDCTFGDCGSSAPQLTSGGLCLDQNQNSIACADPNCTFGDCTSTASQSNPVAISAATSSGATALSQIISSATSVATSSLAAQTAPKTNIVTPLGSFSSSGISSGLIFIILAIVAFVLFAGKKRA